MAVRYHHTQRGTLMLVALLGSVVLLALVGYLVPPPARWVVWTMAALSVVMAVLFSSLTVEVEEREVSWHFGPGLWRYRIARPEIESVAVVRNSWLHGFGIRVGPGFRLYNVSGLDAVELRLKTGDIRRIGTDDAQGLAAALKSERAAPLAGACQRS